MHWSLPSTLTFISVLACPSTDGKWFLVPCAIDSWAVCLGLLWRILSNTFLCFMGIIAFQYSLQCGFQFWGWLTSLLLGCTRTQASEWGFWASSLARVDLDTGSLPPTSSRAGAHIQVKSAIFLWAMIYFPLKLAGPVSFLFLLSHTILKWNYWFKVSLVRI